MNRKYYIFALTFAALFLSENSSAQYKTEDFRILYNLAGTWEMLSKNGTLRETWNIRNDSLLESISYRINKSDTITEETVNLCLSNGTISYIPTVLEQNQGKPIVFQLSEKKGNHFVFENSLHDFPQRIIYDLKNTKELLVLINGNTPNGFKEISFKFKRK
jgi:hypothetical protein